MRTVRSMRTEKFMQPVSLRSQLMRRVVRLPSRSRRAKWLFHGSSKLC